MIFRAITRGPGATVFWRSEFGNGKSFSFPEMRKDKYVCGLDARYLMEDVVSVLMKEMMYSVLFFLEIF